MIKYATQYIIIFYRAHRWYLQSPPAPRNFPQSLVDPWAADSKDTAFDHPHAAMIMGHHRDWGKKAFYEMETGNEGFSLCEIPY